MAPWTAAFQAPLFVRFPRQEYWSGWPFPSPEDLPHPGIDPSPALLVDSLPLSLQGSHELNFIPQQQQKRIPFFSLHLYYQNCIEVLLYFEFSQHNFCERLFPLINSDTKDLPLPFGPESWADTLGPFQGSS